jgi:choice-of-anchor B domain-containing protein
MALDTGTAFVDATDPVNPVYLGRMRTQTANSNWREFKIARNHLFVTSEASGHGMQVFDLTRLRGLSGPPAIFTPDAVYSRFGRAHNVAANDASGFVYATGIRSEAGQPHETCNSGLHMIDARDPKSPTFAGCFGDVGYIHDVKCVIYDGPDTRFTGREICYASAADLSSVSSNRIAIVDVTDKSNPVLLSEGVYPNPGYTHQAWPTEDGRYLLVADEFDEIDYGFNSRVIVIDIQDLLEPVFYVEHFGQQRATSHNLYVQNQYAFVANYSAGLRVLDLAGIDQQVITEVASFDTYPEHNDAGYLWGAWNAFPYFASGTVVISDIQRGLFLVRPRLERWPSSTETPPDVASSLAVEVSGANPFRAGTRIAISAAQTQRIRVEVYDVLGRQTALLFDGVVTGGSRQSLMLDGERLAPGTYLVRATGETGAASVRVTRLR